MNYSERIIDCTGGHLICSMIRSVDLDRYGVSRIEDLGIWCPFH